MASTPKRCPSVNAARMPHSAMPSTGLRVASRALCRPGSLKQATTKAAASLSRARMVRQSGAMTLSASLWLSIPGGPSARVTHSIAGPPGMRSGASPSSIAAVTATVELGLMTITVSATACLSYAILVDALDHGIEQSGAPFLEVADRISHHRAELGAQDEMDPEHRLGRRLSSRLGPLGTRLLNGDLGLVFPNENAKAGAFQCRTRRLRWDEKADALLARPRHRVVRLAARSGGHVLQRKTTRRFEDAADLAVEKRAIGDIHRGILRPYEVEFAVGERHRCRIAVAVVDKPVEPGAPRQHRGDTTELGGEVEAGDVAAIGRGEIARWTADAGTDIEDEVPRGRGEQGSELGRRGAPPGMEFIDRREIVGGQAIYVFAGMRERRENRLAELRPGVMSLDVIAGIVHRCDLPMRRAAG